LREYQAQLERGWEDAEVRPSIDAEAEARLRALGYIE
jgi:hypothetical protein